MIHPADQPSLTLLQREEGNAADRGKREVGEQELEREEIGGDRLGNRNLLDAAHVADLPVALLALRMTVVAGHACRPHDHRRNQANAVAGERPGRLDQPLIGVLAQARQRLLLEIVEDMRRPVCERHVGDEAVLDVLLLLADHVPEFERQRGRDRNGAGNRFVVVHHLGRSRICEDAADDVRAVIAPHAGDHRVEVGRLPPQIRVGEMCEVEPDCSRQRGKQRSDSAGDQQAARAQPDRCVICHPVSSLAQVGEVLSKPPTRIARPPVCNEDHPRSHPLNMVA